MRIRTDLYQTRARRSALLGATVAALIASGSGMSGCKKNTAASTATTDPTLVSGDYVALYEAHRYAEAKVSAENRIPRAEGHEKEVAQLTAGLSSYALGNLDDATRYLEPLTTSKDTKVAGRAEATLGQIAQQRGQHAYAASLLTRASAKLDGDDSARASVRAGNSLAAIGKQAEATTQYKAAATEASSEAVRKHAEALTAPGPFALQAGVYTTKANADKRAAELRAQTAQLGYGSPRVVPDTVNGKPAYAVQIGKFSNRQLATQAKGNLGTQMVVVQAE